MKKIVYTLMAVALLCSCNHKQPTTEPTAESGHAFIQPLPAGYSLDSLQDVTIPASFTCDDFNWRGSNLTLTVYSENLYDAVQMHQLALGDTLVYDGRTMVVDSIGTNNGFISINGGIEQEGADLMPYEGGTYRAVQWDDHSVYTEMGKAELELADDFMIIDCGENPTDPSDTIRTNQKQYLDNLKDSRREFINLNTLVLVENGKVTCITRRWIP